MYWYIIYNIKSGWTLRQSVAVQRDGASRLDKKYSLQHPGSTPGMHFWAICILLPPKKQNKNKIQEKKNNALEKTFKLIPRTTYKKVFLKYQTNARFHSLC